MRPFLSLALLAYNEKDTLRRAATRCSGVLEGCGISYELVLVDDGSTDGSGEIMQGLAGELPGCRAIRHPRNLGIGAGIRTCYFATTGEWATWFPADLQADPGELPRLLEFLSQCDVLVTYRDSRRRQESARRKLVSSADRALVRLLFGLCLKDLHWIRFFRRDVLTQMKLSCRSPSIDTEMVLCARQLGARMLQVPLADHPRQAGTPKGASLRNIFGATAELLALRFRSVERPAKGERGTGPFPGRLSA